MLLSNDWRPKRISNVLTSVGTRVSHEWIYRYVARDKHQDGQPYRRLRQGHKRYRKGLKEKIKMLMSFKTVYTQSLQTMVENYRAMSRLT